MFRAVRCCVLPALLLCCTACSGPQSTLAPAGADSENIARLFFWMTGLFAFIWAAVVTLALLLPRLHSLATDKAGRLLIVGGGVVLPVTVLTVLLVICDRSATPLLAVDALLPATRHDLEDVYPLD